MRNLGFDGQAGSASMAGVHTPERRSGSFAGKSVASMSGERPMLWAIDLVGWLKQFGTTLARCTATLTYGSGGDGGGAVEIVEVDWPQQGTTVMVHARDVRVEANYTVAQLDLTGQRFPPNLAAWITPGNGSNRPMTATLTTPTVNSGAGVSTGFDVPERARAYRYFNINSLGPLDLVSASQMTNGATPIAVGGDVLGTAAEALALIGVSNWSQPANRAGWFPLHPRAATLNVASTASVIEYSIQWLLELG